MRAGLASFIQQEVSMKRRAPNHTACSLNTSLGKPERLDLEQSALKPQTLTPKIGSTVHTFGSRPGS